MRPYTANETGALVPDMNTELVVYRDWCNGNGAWRLAWLDANGTTYSWDTSHVTGQPFFRRMSDAVYYGEKHYGVRARRDRDLD